MKVIKNSSAKRLKMQSRFNAVFEKRGRWWIGYVEELPGEFSLFLRDHAREKLDDRVEHLRHEDQADHGHG
jgi:hypothetical protein